MLALSILKYSFVLYKQSLEKRVKEKVKSIFENQNKIYFLLNFYTSFHYGLLVSS